MAIRAGLGQGAYAFVSTWLVTLSSRKLLVAFGANIKGLVISFVLTFAVMLLLPLTLHQLLGTLNIWAAILPGLLWGGGYIAVVLFLDYRILLKQQK